ncbi:MAG TPA: hypothetical protein ENJ97_07345 [Planctomycetes bacterium]|nr:hypothetical protein [Planctomycetota bacterium]
MRIIACILTLPLLAGMAAGQCKARAVSYGQGSNLTVRNGHVALPDYQRTYTSSFTRGFYFQAPAKFVALGLQVPDEKNQGFQHVALYKFNAEPPAFPKTVPGVPVFYKEKVPSNRIIPILPPVVFNKGDWVAVIGACSGTSTSRLYNSYGPTGGFASKVLGQPVTLYRCGMQANLVSTKGKFNIWSEKKYNVCRIRLFLGGQQGSIPALTTTAKPVLGTTAGLQLTAGNMGATAGLVFLGRGRAAISTVFGKLLVPPPYYLSFVTGPAGGRIALPIPNNNVLLCAGPLNFQGFFVFSQGVTMTAGVEWFLGN